MRSALPERLEQGRMRQGFFGSDASYGFTGMFHVMGPCGRMLRIIAGNGFGWEHVSVSTQKHVPNWQEMCFVKDLFWDDEETVIQYHPPKSEYVNNAPNCLHLWRPIDKDIPLPPSDMVGIKGLPPEALQALRPAEIHAIHAASVAASAAALESHESKPASPI